MKRFLKELATMLPITIKECDGAVCETASGKFRRQYIVMGRTKSAKSGFIFGKTVGQPHRWVMAHNFIYHLDGKEPTPTPFSADGMLADRFVYCSANKAFVLQSALETVLAQFDLLYYFHYYDGKYYLVTVKPFRATLLLSDRKGKILLDEKEWKYFYGTLCAMTVLKSI